MVYLHRIYTKAGDQGETMLGDGSMIDKTHPRVKSMAEVDLVNSLLGLAVISCQNQTWQEQLNIIQNNLFDVGADLCLPISPEPVDAESNRPPLRITPQYITQLENWMDELTPSQKPLDSFILPGGTELATRLHIARSSCRQAELVIWDLVKVEQLNLLVPQYMNRLADFLFVLAREANNQGGLDIKWVPGLALKQYPKTQTK
jgi:cob(I)alamin adenosyltransferase